ncbi:GlsB/YeaQ/YmgE family stress response membrane protein [Lutibacter sp. B1]|uniref:GlsB/YeaQ/YmgE family stress response membrane protein n=1 Tax=Lutibacter sp. B1 TaxID=2725996 RepID=UPI0014566963|nr:GlsB/YeaQ/YmgE family stress response membrane protein [Lutibacter sp. B1]NLP57032.1 GlsB/YeaQ/YmgE family stress response membrane protein [Lutibacter sp. B1]
MLYSIVIGGIAGWLAGKIMKGGGYGILMNIVLGIIGGLVGGWLFGTLGIYIVEGTIGDLIEGVIGAIVILFIAGLLKKK